MEAIRAPCQLTPPAERSHVATVLLLKGFMAQNKAPVGRRARTNTLNKAVTALDDNLYAYLLAHTREAQVATGMV